VFGDGDETSFWPLAASADVVAHEYTHGITFATAKLGTSGETGALNEAISDLFACFATYGSGRGATWQVGETVFHQGNIGRPLRDLANPRASGNPSRLEEFVLTLEDQGGVHLNSTIISHAGYLLSEGSPKVLGVGNDLAQRIWYRALTRYLTSGATFLDAVDATIAAARDLRRGEPSVRQAWVAVGLLNE
jgi:Zn-dependent metalloprotease